jgi:hypothetical protein
VRPIDQSAQSHSSPTLYWEEKKKKKTNVSPAPILGAAGAEREMQMNRGGDEKERKELMKRDEDGV